MYSPWVGTRQTTTRIQRALTEVRRAADHGEVLIVRAAGARSGSGPAARRRAVREGSVTAMWARKAVSQPS